MISCKQTIERLAEDKHRLLGFYQKENVKLPLTLLFNTSYQAVLLFRLSHYFYSKKWHLLARIFWHGNLWLTGVNISPETDLKGGFILNIPLGVTVKGRIGRNCTIIGNSSIVKNSSKENAGAGPGLPMVGDNVFIGIGATIYGPVTVGNNSYIGCLCLIDSNLPENSIVELSAPIKRIAKI